MNSYKLLLVLSLITAFSINYTFGQESLQKFKIVNNNSGHNNQYYIDALEKANMESYRLKNKDVELTFKEGVSCILISAVKLSEHDKNIDLNLYKEDFPTGYILPTFSINPDGYLLADYKKKLK